MSHGSSSVHQDTPGDTLQLIGTSPAIRRVSEEIALAARCDAKVLITGESGTGKEVITRLIHAQSRRAHHELITLNCGAFVETVLESELFGHVRGSFTGADRERMGHLERAHRGTAFLDEIGEMSPRMQGALLRFLETGEIQRVGDDRPRTRVDVRVVAATNRDLAEAIDRKEFREDLFYRLNVVHIEAPALRDRREDIPALLAHFSDVFSRSHGAPRVTFSAAALSALQRHSWPGNVRELRNLVERLVIYTRNGEVTEAGLPEDFKRPAAEPSISTVSGAAAVARTDALFTRLRVRRESFWSAVYAPYMSRDLTRNEVRQIVTRGLTETRGNYRALVPLFNMPNGDYKRFLNFLKKHSCHVAFQPFRLIGVDLAPAETAA